MQGANLGATKQSKFFADPELTEISMRLYVPLLENDQRRGHRCCRHSRHEAGKAGGKIANGPMEVPGGQWVVTAQDPQGAFFSLVSATK